MALQVKCEKHDIVYIAADIKIGKGPSCPECRKEWLEEQKAKAAPLTLGISVSDGVGASSRFGDG